MHVLARFLTPVPHGLSQSPKAPHSEKPPSTGHGFTMQAFVSSVAPSQILPPNCGAGFVQDRARFCTPSPQVLSHSENGLHSVNPPSMGHSFFLHFSSSLPGPSFCSKHVLPKAPGVGFVQYLVLECFPSPHSAEHGCHSDQSVYPPSIKALRSTKYNGITAKHAKAVTVGKRQIFAVIAIGFKFNRAHNLHKLDIFITSYLQLGVT